MILQKKVYPQYVTKQTKLRYNNLTSFKAYRCDFDVLKMYVKLSQKFIVYVLD